MGSYGPDVKFDVIEGKRKLVFLDIEMECYPDDIVSVSYYYAVSSNLKAAIEANNLTGACFRKAQITEGENLDKINESLNGLVYYQLIVVGSPYKDDFSEDAHYLVVSERALSVISQFSTSNLQNYDTGSDLDALPEI